MKWERPILASPVRPFVHHINPCLYPTILKLGRNDSGAGMTQGWIDPPTKAETTHLQYWQKWTLLPWLKTTHSQYWPKRTSQNYPGPKRPGTRIGYRAKYNLSWDWFTQRLFLHSLLPYLSQLFDESNIEKSAINESLKKYLPNLSQSIQLAGIHSLQSSFPELTFCSVSHQLYEDTAANWNDVLKCDINIYILKPVK